MVNYKEEELTKIVKQIAKDNNLSENVKVTLSKGSEKGDGFMGEIVMISVEDETSKEKMELIAKISMKDSDSRETTPLKTAYENEMFVYETVFPALKEIQHKAKILEPFNSIPKCYAVSKDNEFIVMENLKKSGYEMRGLKDLLDHEHIELIFKRYGELHALSFAMQVLEPKKYQHLEKGLINVWGVACTGKYEIIDILDRVLVFVQKSMDEKGYHNEHYNTYVKNFSKIMTEMVSNEEKNFTCVLHMDCWSNNMLFKYKQSASGRKELEKMKILDWQAASIGPPVLDLSDILYTGATKEVLDNLYTYLKIYHESLSNFLSQFNLDANSIYPFDELLKQWKKYYHFGALLGGTVWKLRSAEEGAKKCAADDNSHQFDSIIKTNCDKDYLVEHMKILCEHFDKIENGEILKEQ